MLKQIKYQLPDNSGAFTKQFLTYLNPLGEVLENKLDLKSSQQNFLPETMFEFINTDIPVVIFVLGDEEHKIEIKNSTGQTKQSPHKYTPVEVADFINRVKDFKLVAIDHTGFNLPWLDGIHPEILKLRELLKDKCLYHEFPKQLADEPWDFILPATIDEISEQQKINYQVTRRPKIEIVSFPKSSTPLIQIDIQLDGRYEDLIKLFPEAIDGPSMRNLWVYIKNDFGIDICFVLNEIQEKDWSHYFERSIVT